MEYGWKCINEQGVMMRTWKCTVLAIAAYVACNSSTGDRSPRRNASTNEQESPNQGVSLIAATLIGSRFRVAAEDRRTEGADGTCGATGIAPAT